MSTKIILTEITDSTIQLETPVQQTNPYAWEKVFKTIILAVIALAYFLLAIKEFVCLYENVKTLSAAFDFLCLILKALSTL